MRRGWLLAVLLVMGMACLGQGRLPGIRDSLDRRNVVRVDLLGPLMYIGYDGQNGFPWRIQAEYGRKLPIRIPLEVTGAIEYLGIQEDFFQAWALEPQGCGPGSLWVGGHVRSRQVSPMLGIRWAWWPEKVVKRLGIFVNPRLAGSFRWGYKRSFLVDGHCTDYHAREFGLTPQLRTGFNFNLGRSIGLEAAVDAIYFKRIGSGSQRWMALPLVNLECRL